MADLLTNQQELDYIINLLKTKVSIDYDYDGDLEKATPQNIYKGYYAYNQDGLIEGQAKTYDEGWLDGRESRNEEIEMVGEEKYLEGFDTGTSSGFKDGFNTFVPLAIQSYLMPTMDSAYELENTQVGYYAISQFKNKKISLTAEEEFQTYSYEDVLKITQPVSSDRSPITIQNKSPYLTVKVFLNCVTSGSAAAAGGNNGTIVGGGVLPGQTPYRYSSPISIIVPRGETVSVSKSIFLNPPPLYISANYSYEVVGLHWTYGDMFPTNDITIEYYPNNTAASGSTIKTQSATVSSGTQAQFTVLSNTYTADKNRYFKGWSTSSTSTKVVYTPGQTIKTSASKKLYAVWGYEYSVQYSLLNYTNSTPYATVVKTYKGDSESFDITLPTLGELGTSIKDGYDHLGWTNSTNEHAVGDTYLLKYSNPSDQYVAYFTIRSAKYPTITYKHTNESNWYGSSGTGPQECYELRINGNAQSDRGEFSNPAAYLSYPRGTTIEVACTYDIESDAYKKGTARIYVNGSEVANNQGTQPSGQYPYASSGSLTYPKDGTAYDVAYYKFTLENDVTIDFVSKTNAPALWNKETYWHCRITK